MATKPLPKPQYCRSCGHTEPHHRATVWLIGLHLRPIQRYTFCANNTGLPGMCAPGETPPYSLELGVR